MVQFSEKEYMKQRLDQESTETKVRNFEKVNEAGALNKEVTNKRINKILIDGSYSEQFMNLEKR